MKKWTLIFLFLLINVIISACTTLAVLFAWDRLRPPLPGGVIQPAVVSLLQPVEPTATIAPAATDLPIAKPTEALEIHAVKDGETFDSIAQTYQVSVEELLAANGYSQVQVLSPGELLRVPIKRVMIDAVIGTGDLTTEHVVLQSNVEGELSLAGWQIDDNQGQVYSLPAVTLFTEGGVLRIYTKIGTDAATELFWGLTSPIWRSGSVVALRDPQGVIQDTYTIP